MLQELLAALDAHQRVSLRQPWTPSSISLSPSNRYENPDVALNCGMMLRECVRHEPLAKIILDAEEFYLFFQYVEFSTFDIASDAFATFRVREHSAASICI